MIEPQNKAEGQIDGSERRTGHEPAARRGARGVHAAQAGEDVGGGRRGGHIRVRGHQTPGESPRGAPAHASASVISFELRLPAQGSPVQAG